MQGDGFHKRRCRAEVVLEIGDAATVELPMDILDSLGINEGHALSILEKTIQGRDELENMARQLAA